MFFDSKPEEGCNVFKYIKYWYMNYICLCLFHLLTCPLFAFYQIQLNDGSHAGIEALESHPIIKRITPHKKLSRSLKFVKGTRTSMLF